MKFAASYKVRNILTRTFCRYIVYVLNTTKRKPVLIKKITCQGITVYLYKNKSTQRARDDNTINSKLHNLLRRSGACGVNRALRMFNLSAASCRLSLGKQSGNFGQLRKRSFLSGLRRGICIQYFPVSANPRLQNSIRVQKVTHNLIIE